MMHNRISEDLIDSFGGISVICLFNITLCALIFDNLE